MELTRSWKNVFPEEVMERYVLRETRNAAAILQATNPRIFDELVEYLNRFEIVRDDLLIPGGQESGLARRFNEVFRNGGWREARVDTQVELTLNIEPYKPAGENQSVRETYSTTNKGYKVDNFKGRVALDLEWNAKDGNLDRDISAYRSLYDSGFIDVGVIVTRTQEDLRTFARELRMSVGMPEVQAKKMLNTTTTTNLEKLVPRMTRGDGGGCPILAVAISSYTYENSPFRF